MGKIRRQSATQDSRLSRWIPSVSFRVDTRQERITLAELALPANADDGRIKTAIAQYLDVPPGRLSLHAVQRHPNGDFTVWPDTPAQ